MQFREVFRFPSRQSLRTSLFILFTFVTSTAQAADICTLNTDEEIIDAAISLVVRAGQNMQKRIEAGECPGIGLYGIPPCVNPFPYRSITEFKSKNPDCCEVLDHIPGDEPMIYRPNLRGEKHPKMYIVRMIFETAAKTDDNKVYQYIRESRRLINCYGEREYY